jgi:hypothetical protein
LLLFFAELKDYLKNESMEIVELLDDFYLLFLNKFEDVVVLLLKSLILGLGCSFEIEKKVSQASITFDFDSRVFKSFLQVVCKLFGCSVSLAFDGKQPEIFSFDPSQAKVRIGKGATISLEITAFQNLNLKYEDSFFSNRGFSLDAVKQAIERGNNPAINRADPLSNVDPKVFSSDEKSREKDGKNGNSDDNFMKAEDYYSNHNIINPYSMYNSEIELKRTSQIDYQSISNHEEIREGHKLQEVGQVRLEDFYSGDLARDQTKDPNTATKISEFFVGPQPGLRIKEPSFQDLDKREFQKTVTPSIVADIRSPDIEPALLPTSLSKDHMVSKPVDSSDEEEPEAKRKSESGEPSILYRYDLEQSIDFVRGTTYFESVDSALKDTGPPPISANIGGHIHASLRPRDSLLLSTMQEQPQIQTSSEKKNFLGDHIKLLLSQDYDSRAVSDQYATIPKEERGVKLPPQQSFKQSENNDKKEQEKPKVTIWDEDLVKPIKTSVTEMIPGSNSKPQDPISLVPTQIQVSNPLMMKLGQYSQITGQSSGKEALVQKEQLQPLVSVNEDLYSRKRPTANVDLMNQINQVLLAKLMNDSGSKQNSSPKLDRPLDFTPLEDKNPPEETSGSRRRSDMDESQSDSMTRKTRFLTQSDTDKACRLCSKLFKMAKMYYFDGSFFCKDCYPTACQKLKQKGINSCGGCKRESAKLLIIKFILSNKFSRAQGSLLFTRDKKVEPYYGYLHRYSLMIAKSQPLERALLLVSNNIVTPLTTWAEVKCCKSCVDDFAKCCMCKDLVFKDELFKADSCGHPYCLDCITVVFLKKYADKREFTCKASFCWKKTSLDRTMNFIIKSLDQLENEINQSGLKVH